MDIVHQILKISVNTRLRVDGLLFRGDQVVELNDANGDCLVLLRLDHQLPELDVLDQLHADDVVEIA